MCKAELAAKLVELGVSSVVVQRQRKGTTAVETLRFDAATFSQRGGAYAPTLAELKAELKAWLDAHPERNKTEVHKLFSQDGYELVYTPPYQPSVQPSSVSGRTSRTTWPLVTRREGACVNF